MTMNAGKGMEVKIGQDMNVVCLVLSIVLHLVVSWWFSLYFMIKRRLFQISYFLIKCISS